MIFSAEQIFSDDQAITASAASTNILDLGAAGTPHGAASAISRDIAKGMPVPILVQVTADFATLTSLRVAIQTDDNTSFSSATTVLESEDVAVANLVAGFKFPFLHLPLGISERYLRLNYTVTGSNATAGTVTAGIVLGIQTND